MCVRFYAQLYFGSAGGPTVAMRAKWVKPQHLETVEVCALVLHPGVGRFTRELHQHQYDFGTVLGNTGNLVHWKHYTEHLDRCTLVK